MISPFRAQLARDVKAVFFNKDEFFDFHDIDGRQMLAAFDSNELLERKGTIKNTAIDPQLFLSDALLYLPAEDYGAPPKPQRVICVDGKEYRITDCSNEDGVYVICLEAMHG